MNLDFRYRDKIPVGILGSTGAIGQKLIELLRDHPWFTLSALAGSERTAGKRYEDVVSWRMTTPLPNSVGDIVINPCTPDLPCSIVFSALDASIAGDVESAFSEKGYYVISKAKNHRMDESVPLVVPEVNASHTKTLKDQKGFIITCPNCVVSPLTLALKPLVEPFGLAALHVVTMQAISGAGFPGVPSLEILDNVIPSIQGEIDKIRSEPGKILGDFGDPLDFPISAQCNRVPVTDGHMISVSVRFEKKPSKEDLIELWENFQAEPQRLELPTAPMKPIHYMKGPVSPQPKLHRDRERGMSISIGQLQECATHDFSFVILSHNTVRGGAGEAILTAELIAKQGLIFW